MAIISYLIPDATKIKIVSTYADLPLASSSTNQFYWVENSTGTSWLPGSLGGTYRQKGLYYSNGVEWNFTLVPYQATQAEVDAGLNTDKFVTANTLFNSSQWSTKVTNRTNSLISTNYLVTNTDRNLECINNIIITLPLLNTITHFEDIYIVNIGIKNIIINTTGGELLLDTESFILYPEESLCIQKGTNIYLVK